jgi:hypothetical protein
MRLLVDLFCGRGGWSESALAAGWRCVGFDCADHGYPGEWRREVLPIAVDVIRELGPSLVVASPPCEEFARACLPWLRSVEAPCTGLLEWSISLVGRVGCPVIVECSRFAARFVGGARFAGSYALWGDVPALLPPVPRRKSMMSGADPAGRAMIAPALADWIIATCH